MPSYRLYYSPGACSLAPHIALEELGIPYEATRVTIAEGLNTRPEYLAINPRGRVPALAFSDGQGEKVLTEALAIMILLARQFPQAQLLPEDTDQFVRAVEWMGWLGSTLHQTGVRMVLRPDRFVSDPTVAEKVAERGREAVLSGMVDIESRLTGKAWALGEHYSLVDAYLLVFFRWGNRTGLPMRVQFPQFTRVMDGVRARPAVRRAVEQEGIQIE
jgi:glutathione S-transferase